MTTEYADSGDLSRILIEEGQGRCKRGDGSLKSRSTKLFCWIELLASRLTLDPCKRSDRDHHSNSSDLTGEGARQLPPLSSLVMLACLSSATTSPSINLPPYHQTTLLNAPSSSRSAINFCVIRIPIDFVSEVIHSTVPFNHSHNAGVRLLKLQPQRSAARAWRPSPQGHQHRNHHRRMYI